jgi:hypothetical protein
MKKQTPAPTRAKATQGARTPLPSSEPTSTRRTSDCMADIENALQRLGEDLNNLSQVLTPYLVDAPVFSLDPRTADIISPHHNHLTEILYQLQAYNRFIYDLTQSVD